MISNRRCSSSISAGRFMGFVRMHSITKFDNGFGTMGLIWFGVVI